MEALSPSAQRRLSRRLKPEERPCYTQRRIVREVTVCFPMPPSANKLYANRGPQGRIKTTAYRAWRNAAVLSASVARPTPGRISGPCDVVIHLPPFQGDTDNRIKPCLDAAKEMGVIADDGQAYIRNVRAIREGEGSLVRLVFTMLAIDPIAVAEAELRAKEGMSVDYIAAAQGLTVGQVRAILAGAAS
ncbi:RusA family crossover junction endodeoxyribonuclease [Methylobacterium sp. CM6247]